MFLTILATFDLYSLILGSSIDDIYKKHSIKVLSGTLLRTTLSVNSMTSSPMNLGFFSSISPQKKDLGVGKPGSP